jgi:hypothetical protein
MKKTVKRYNLSNIMKNAWRYVKAAGLRMKAFSRTGGSPLEGAFVRGSMCLIGRKQSI